jgi:epoxyqueuosine reductase
LFLGELILDKSLEQDKSFNEDLCGTCVACIEACPTQALNEYEIDAGKCISYLSIEYRGSFTDDQDHLNEWIYGCDICQEVCPWNEKFSKKTAEKAFQIRQEILNFENSDWDKISEEEFRSIFKKSSVKRTKFSGLDRNIQHNKKIK